MRTLMLVAMMTLAALACCKKSEPEVPVVGGDAAVEAAPAPAPDAVPAEPATDVEPAPVAPADVAPAPAAAEAAPAADAAAAPPADAPPAG